jgi:phage gpG-like protein
MPSLPFGALVAAMNATDWQAQKALKEALPILKVISVAGTREHFAESRGPDGKPWPALKHPRPDGGNKPLLDKGLLQASISASVTQEELWLRANHPGAAVHQFGATIVPKRAKALTIPVSKEAKRIGSPGRGRFPRPLFVVARGAGQTGFLAEGRPDGKGITIHYLLRRSVTIPARPYLGWSESTIKKMERVLADKLADVMMKPFGQFNIRISGPGIPGMGG